MSLSLLIGAIWVIAATIVAFLPMRRQYAPGVILLLAAPVLIGLIVYDHGWLWGGAALFAFLSMFRNPLIYLARRAMGRPVIRPEDAMDSHDG
jgi:hypothetical protein